MGNKLLLDLPDAKFSDHLHHYCLSYAFLQLLKLYDSSTVHHFDSQSTSGYYEKSGIIRRSDTSVIKYSNEMGGLLYFFNVSIMIFLFKLGPEKYVVCKMSM